MAERNRPHACLDDDCLSDSDHACCGGPSCDVCHPRLTQGQPESAPLAHELINDIKRVLAYVENAPNAELGAANFTPLLRHCLIALSAAPPAQPHPEAPQGEEARENRWEGQLLGMPMARDPRKKESNEAWEWAKAHEQLDSLGVPHKNEDGILYSLVGRIDALHKASQPPPEALRAHQERVWLAHDGCRAQYETVATALRAAQEEIEAWKREVNKHNELRQEANAKLEAQTEALREYGQHKEGCAVDKWLWTNDGTVAAPACTCGLDALSASPAPHTEKGKR